MKKLFTFIIGAIFLCHAHAYEVGDYVYTSSSKFKVISENLLPVLTNWTGADDVDTWAVSNMGDAPSNNLESLGESEEASLLYTSVPTNFGSTYIISLKIKGVNETSSSITAGTQNQINAFVTNAAPSSDGVLTGTANTDYFMVATTQTIPNNEWTEIVFEYTDTLNETTIGSDTHYLNVVLGRLTTGTIIADVEIHEIISVFDTRISDNQIAFVQKIIADENFSGGDASEIHEIIETYHALVEAGESDDTASMADLMSMLNEATIGFMDASSSNLSSYFEYFDITSMPKYNRGNITDGRQIGGFIFHGTNWLHVAQEEVLAKQIHGTYVNEAGSVALYNNQFPSSRKYYIAGEVRNALCDRNLNLTYTLEKNVKMFIGSDTLDIGTISGPNWQRFYYIASLPNAEPFEAGFWWEGHTTGSRFEVRNLDVRVINNGTEFALVDTSFVQAQATLLAEIETATALLDDKNNTTGHEELSAAIDSANVSLGSATTEEELAIAVEALKAAEQAFEKANLIASNAALVAGASAENPVDAPFIVNGTFDSDTNGWTATGDFQNHALANNQNGDFTAPFWENWNSSAKVNKMYQTIENIPNGVYKLKIAAFVGALANPNESQYVFANDDKTYLTTVEPTFYEVYTIVTNNALDVGLAQTEAVTNWMGIDNVSLTYFGADSTIINNQNGVLLEEVSETLAAKQSVKTKDALQTAYETFVTDGNEENKAILQAALNLAKESVNSYTILETGFLPDNSIEGWTCTNSNNFQVNTWSTEGNNDGTGMETPFIENWIDKNHILGTGEIYYILPGLDPGFYSFSALVRVYSETGNTPTGASIFAGDNEIGLTTGKEFDYNSMRGIYTTYSLTTEVGEDGIFKFGVKILDTANFNWVAIKNVNIGELPDSMTISDNLTLTDFSQFDGIRNIEIASGGTLTIGEIESAAGGLVLNNFNLDMDFFSDVFAQILSNTDVVTITGDLTQRIYTQGMTWNFMSLPFDCDLSRLVNEGGSPYAIRYYDGASRAATATAQGNWRDYGQNDIIPMGTGFIFMTRDDSWTRFYAADNENKAHVFVPTSTDTSLGLAQNESESFVHRGWNLVGNPYANYYDGGHVDFGKALTLWNGSTYEACYTGDDAFVIRPNQAFFVQCPREGDSAIGFPGAGRQLTATPTSGAKARAARRNPNRRLVNLSLTDRTFTDKTRIVLNEEAQEDYELDCDAGKFMSLRPEVPQLYSIGRDGTHYAINERPKGDGKVSLGLYIPEDGEYTISVTRNDAERVRLTDSETGQTVELDESGYTFQARKGTYTRRLSLWIDTDATGIIEIASESSAESPASWYTLDGRPLQGQPTTTGVYLVKEGSEVRKVYVRE